MSRGTLGKSCCLLCGISSFLYRRIGVIKFVKDTEIFHSDGPGNTDQPNTRPCKGYAFCKRIRSIPRIRCISSCCFIAFFSSEDLCRRCSIQCLYSPLQQKSPQGDRKGTTICQFDTNHFYPHPFGSSHSKHILYAGYFKSCGSWTGSRR